MPLCRSRPICWDSGDRMADRRRVPDKRWPTCAKPLQARAHRLWIIASDLDFGEMKYASNLHTAIKGEPFGQTQSPMSVMVVGQTRSTAEQLRQRLARHEIACEQASTVPLAIAIEMLTGTQTQPDIVFYHSADSVELDCKAVARLRASTRAEIAVVGAMSQPRDVLELVRSGATDCLQDSQQFCDDLTALVSRMSGRSRPRKRGKIVSVVPVSGGCGASTVAINLCATLAKHQGKTALVELNSHGGDSAAMLNLRPQHTLAELCASPVDVDVEMLEKSLADHPSGIRLLASPSPWNRTAPITREAALHILGLSARLSSHVLVDLQDMFREEEFAVVQTSDLVLLVLRLEFPCLLRTERMLAFFEEQGVEPNRVKLVVNRHDKNCQLRASQVIQALGRPIDHYLPDDYATATLCSSVGNPVVTEAPLSRLAVAYATMVDSLFEVEHRTTKSRRWRQTCFARTP